MKRFLELINEIALALGIMLSLAVLIAAFME